MESQCPDGPSRRLGRERRHSAGSAGMRTQHTASIRLLLLGAGPRLLGAALIVAALWAGFFWATSTQGAP